jgi:RNA polymerase sigma factor (sigma-70 family)
MIVHDIHSTIETVWKIESAKIIAGLARIVQDVGMAEDLAQDALVIALEKWKESGVPHNPGAWLMAIAKNRAIDELRRKAILERKKEILERETEILNEISAVDSIHSDSNGNDLLNLIFIVCHPILSSDARVALALRLLGGLTTGEIARAFLIPETTLAQRIVRAKRTLTEARIPFVMPSDAELDSRVSSVLEVIYLIFNEGYTATSGENWMRPTFCEEAMRLGRILAELIPKEPEVHGLMALMEIQASRIPARTNHLGKPIPLLEQNRGRWDRLLIGRGLKALDRVEKLGEGLGYYSLQAAIAACHARALKAEDTDWKHILALYDGLIQIAPSPIIELNRAVTLSMAYGPLEGLALVNKLALEPSLENYHHLASVRADLLFKLGQQEEARKEFERAASLTYNMMEKGLLLERARK